VRVKHRDSNEEKDERAASEIEREDLRLLPDHLPFRQS
jgi:hypothetical protein